MKTRHLAALAVAAFLPASLLLARGGNDDGGSGARPLPEAVQKVFNKPRYRDATWALRVVDLDTGELLHDVNGDRRLKIGSVRKLFSVGLALHALGADHRFRTPIHRQGTVDAAGVLDGNLVLVASGDLAMGGRTLPDGSFAVTNFDHNEANALGNAVLSAPDPLAGFDRLARQVAAAGIKRVAGDVVIDERLFEPFDFRGEFKVGAMFVNDDVVDVSIDASARVDWRPKSAAFPVGSSLSLGAPDSAPDLRLDPQPPTCIGTPGCGGRVLGSLPAGFVPPFTGGYPLIRTFRITQPANYARSVLIEALGRAGVAVDAPTVAPNPAQLLPASRDYDAATRVAELVSHPYQDDVRYILKVSYNIGADTSLMLLGLTQGATTRSRALAAERTLLARRYGIASDQVDFIDGSGGGNTTATASAVVELLRALGRSPGFAVFRDAQPRLGVDGSLSFVTDFEADPSLAGAKGNVHAKTGTYVTGGGAGLVYEAQTLAGYIVAKSGRRLAFSLAVNDIGVIGGIDAVPPVFQDEGMISAILWSRY